MIELAGVGKLTPFGGEEILGRLVERLMEAFDGIADWRIGVNGLRATQALRRKGYGPSYRM